MYVRSLLRYATSLPEKPLNDSNGRESPERFDNLFSSLAHNDG